MRNMILRAATFLLILAGFVANTFAQTITITNIDDVTPCAGDTITVSYSASQVMNGNNIYHIEISDTADNFSNPTIIGMLASVSDNSMITGIIPSGIIQDNTYLMRVVSSSPLVISATETFHVEQNPGMMAGSNSPVIAGDSLFLMATSDPGASFLWHHPDGVTTSAQQFPVLPNVSGADAGTYTVDVTGVNGCKNSSSVVVDVETYIITIPTVASSYCDGATAVINFTVSRDFHANNIFIAELSDLTGGFDNPVEIGELHSNMGGVMHVEFPTGITGGTGYRMRIVASTPSVTSNISASFHLRPNTQPNVQADGPLTFCEGENVTLTASGGVQYLWSNGGHAPYITVNQTGNYAVTMTDQYGCVGTTVKSILVHAASNAYIIHVGSTELCEGEAVRLVAYDGSSYAWSNGAHTQSITVDEAGNYNVTVTNNHGCAKAATAVEVTVIPRPDVTMSHTGDVEICMGETVTLSLTSGYENYFWTNGGATPSIDVNTAGDYSATVFDDAGCSVTTEPVHVIVHDAPTMPDITYNSGTGELLSTAGQFYQWYKDGVPIDDAIYHHLLVRGINGIQEGTYTVEVSNVYGCSKMSATYELFEVVSGITQKEKRILSLYPNPNNGIFEVNIPENAGTHIVITNAIGSVVYDAENSFERAQIDLTHLKSGVYFLKAYDGSAVSSVMFLKN